MRKYFGILFILLAFSCRKEEGGRVIPVASDVPIIFHAGLSQTKGMDELNDEIPLAAQDFSVSAWYTPEAETFGSQSRPYIQNHRFGTLSDTPKAPGTLWQGITRTGGKAADPVYYPLDGTLTYFCYAPYRANVGSASDIYFIYSPDNEVTALLDGYLPYSPLIRFTPSESPSSQIDFLAARPVLDKQRGSGVVPLDFSQHLLTRIEFFVKYNGSMSDGEGVTISQITIKDVVGSEYLYFTDDGAGNYGHAWCRNVSPEDGSAIMPKASYYLTTSSADLDGSYLTSSFPADPINGTLNGRLYLLPQTIPDGAQLEMTYVIKKISTGAALDENRVTFDLYGTTDWPMGKIVRYYITIDVAARQTVNVDGEIIDWIDSGNIHAEEEIMY